MDLTLQFLKEGKKNSVWVSRPQTPSTHIRTSASGLPPPPSSQKKKIQPAQTPPTLSPVTMIMVYGFMDYLNHVDLLIPNVYVLRKQHYCLMCT